MRFASRTIGEKIPFFAPPIKTAAWTGGARRLGAVTPRLGRGAKADAAETAQSARRRVRAISGMCCAVECYLCCAKSAARSRCQRGLARSLLLDDVKSGALQRGSNSFLRKYYTTPNALARSAGAVQIVF